MANGIATGINPEEEKKKRRRGRGVTGFDPAEQVEVRGGRVGAKVSPAAGVPVSRVSLPRTSADTGYFPVESKPMIKGAAGELIPHVTRPFERERAITPAVEVEAPLLAGLDENIRQPAAVGGIPGATAAAPETLYAPDLGEGVPAGAAAAGTAAKVDIPEAPEVDRGRALRRGALVAGLTMLERGGRAYDRPVDASSIIGTGGLAGVGAYEGDIDRQRGEFEQEQKLKAGGIKLAGAEQELAERPLETEAKQLSNEKMRLAISGYKGDLKVKNMLNKAQLDFAEAKTPEERNAIVKFIADVTGEGAEKDKGFQTKLVYEDVTAPGAFTPERKLTKIYDPNTREFTDVSGGGAAAAGQTFQEGKSYRDTATGKTFKFVNGEKVYY